VPTDGRVAPRVVEAGVTGGPPVATRLMGDGVMTVLQLLTAVPAPQAAFDATQVEVEHQTQPAASHVEQDGEVEQELAAGQVPLAGRAYPFGHVPAPDPVKHCPKVP